MPGARKKSYLTPLFVAVACLALAHAGAAAVFDATPDDYRALLTRLRAGDTLVLSGGEYLEGLPAHGLSGGPGRPITISGPERGPPATFVAQAGHNTVSIVDSHHLVHEQDVDICARVQRSHTAGLDAGGVLATTEERGVFFLHEHLRRALAGDAIECSTRDPR